MEIQNDSTKLDLISVLCLSATDGVYKDECASDFVVCVNNTGIALHCTNSLKYDEVSGMCVDEVRKSFFADFHLSFSFFFFLKDYMSYNADNFRANYQRAQ